MSWKLFLAASAFGCAIATSSASAASDDWSKGWCSSGISLFGSGVPFQVERIRLRTGVNAPTGIPIELDHGKDGWSGQVSVPIGKASRSEYEDGIRKGGWIAFKRKGSTEIWSQVFADQGGGCLVMDNVGGSRTQLPASVLAYFEGVEAKAGAVRDPAAISPICIAQAAKMPGYRPVVLKTVEGAYGPTFTAEGLPQTILDSSDISERQRWAHSAEAQRAWALYFVGGENYVEEPQVRYLFDNAGECLAKPDKPTRVDMGALPNSVVEKLLKQYSQPVDGSPLAQRQRLERAMAESSETARRGVPTPSPAEPVQQAGLELNDGGDEEQRMLMGDELKEAIKSYPPAILKQLVKWQKTCRDMGDEDASIDSEFVTRIDLDGDQQIDYVTNGDHVFCVRKNGIPQMIGGGNGATNITVVMTTPRGAVQVASVMAASGSISRYEGFAVMETQYDAKLPFSYLLLRNGKSQKINGKPKDGTDIYTIAR